MSSSKKKLGMAWRGVGKYAVRNRFSRQTQEGGAETRSPFGV